jgi:excisionase family DNA binding protein
VPVAGILATSDRFPRRLIAERRIRFVRVGRHVRIPESALREFIDAGMIEPSARPRRRRRGGLMGGNTKGSRRRFGAVRRLPSGQWQARYLGPDSIMRSADRTFATKTEVERWLTRIGAEIIDGDWIDPEAGRVAFGVYAAGEGLPAAAGGDEHGRRRRADPA